MFVLMDGRSGAAKVTGYRHPDSDEDWLATEQDAIDAGRAQAELLAWEVT